MIALARRATLGALFAGSLLTLGGCALPFMSPPNAMTVANGAVTIVGPQGFCVDQQSSHDGPGAPFVLLGSCASMAGSPTDPKPRIQALLTATVSVGSNGPSIGDANWRQLVAYLHSTAGRKAQSRSGDARTVKIIGLARRDGVVILHARDTSPFPGQTVTPNYWRALFDLNGHIVTLSVNGVPQAPFPDSAGLALLETFVASVRAASAPPAPAAGS
ncbi:MAG: hypothetical protein KGI94_04580 [Paracoccaceae bacterium]|nr:hypothetical protein [Paracoccaceae bacterium]MDE3120236.1 hypothetical protein [Paracoccaceae bacterium]MDE3239928.1 hypothetical protein [Paracoccaceae bacterium]